MSNYVSSLNTILRSIKNDRYTFRWFLFFIRHSTVKTEMANQKNWIRQNKKLHLNIFLEDILKIFLILMAAILTQTVSYLLIFCGILLWIALLQLHAGTKNIVCEMIRPILVNNYPENELKEKTLYQITESLARQHKIFSLVDLIDFQDRIYTYTLIIVFIATCVIYMLRLWQIISFLAASILIIHIMINLSIVLKRLR